MLLLLLVPTLAAAPALAPIRDRYIDRYFAAWPTVATQAGRHDHDRELESWTEPRRKEWLDFNGKTLAEIEAWKRTGSGTPDDRLDAEEIFAYARARVPQLLRKLTDDGRQTPVRFPRKPEHYPLLGKPPARKG